MSWILTTDETDCMQRRKGLFRKCFVGNLLSRRPTSRTSFKWAGNIKMDYWETGWEGVNRTQVAKNRTLCIVIIWYWTPEFHKSRDLTKLKTISIAQKMPCNSELVYTIKREIWGLRTGNMLHSVPCGILIHSNILSFKWRHTFHWKPEGSHTVTMDLDAAWASSWSVQWPGPCGPLVQRTAPPVCPQSAVAALLLVPHGNLGNASCTCSVNSDNPAQTPYFALLANKIST